MAPDLTPQAWAQIRYAYEHTERPIADICAEHGISDGTLRDRMRRWHWTRRREPIPREGPPALMPPVEMALDALPPTPDPSPQGGGEQAEFTAPIVPTSAAEADADPAAIVPRLQSAVARVLPAIEATLGRLAAGPQRPREMEQTARTLATLMRTLRELNAALREQPLRGRDDDPVPEDIDEFRFELARRIRAFVASRQAENGEEDGASSSVHPRESGDPGAEDSEQAGAGLPLARE